MGPPWGAGAEDQEDRPEVGSRREGLHLRDLVNRGSVLLDLVNPPPVEDEHVRDGSPAEGFIEFGWSLVAEEFGGNVVPDSLVESLDSPDDRVVKRHAMAKRPAGSKALPVMSPRVHEGVA